MEENNNGKFKWVIIFLKLKPKNKKIAPLHLQYLSDPLPRNIDMV